MKAIDWLRDLLLRFRYPVTLPEEIAAELGMAMSNHMTFHEFVCQLTQCPTPPRHLCRFMPRELAESVFQSAQRKDKFGKNSLFSYYFEEGWLEFNLQFDDQSRLRRLYLQHKQLNHDRGLEIRLKP